MNSIMHFLHIAIRLPCQPWARCYDMINEVVWINTAAPKWSNLVRLVQG